MVIVATNASAQGARQDCKLSQGHAFKHSSGVEAFKSRPMIRVAPHNLKARGVP